MKLALATITDLNELKNEILQEINKISKFVKYQNLPEWCNDELCFNLKGGAKNLQSFRTHLYYQPLGGIGFKYVNGRKCWNKRDVIEWLQITDEDLKEYHEKHKTGAKK